MGPLALVLIALAGWLVWTGRLSRMSGVDGMMLGVAIVGAVLAARGQPLIGGGALAIALVHNMRRAWQRSGARNTAVRPDEPADVATARALLGLSPDCDAAMVRAAHRRLIARVHPDAGGTSALAGQLNDARDVMLRHLRAGD